MDEAFAGRDGVARRGDIRRASDGVLDVQFGPYRIATLHERTRIDSGVRLIRLGRCAPSLNPSRTGG